MTTEELSLRRQVISEAVNSVALEGFKIEAAQLANFERYATGEITLEQMDQHTKQYTWAN